MGNFTAQALADDVALERVRLGAALTVHLRSNHYPPHPLFMVKCLKEALGKYGTDNDQIHLERDYGVSHRLGDVVSAATVIESLNAWAFVPYQEDSHV